MDTLNLPIWVRYLLRMSIFLNFSIHFSDYRRRRRKHAVYRSSLAQLNTGRLKFEFVAKYSPKPPRFVILETEEVLVVRRLLHNNFQIDVLRYLTLTAYLIVNCVRSSGFGILIAWADASRWAVNVSLHSSEYFHWYNVEHFNKVFLWSQITSSGDTASNIEIFGNKDRHSLLTRGCLFFFCYLWKLNDGWLVTYGNQMKLMIAKMKIRCFPLQGTLTILGYATLSSG